MKTDFQDTCSCQKWCYWKQNTGEMGMQGARTLLPRKCYVEMCPCLNRSPKRKHKEGAICDMGHCRGVFVLSNWRLLGSNDWRHEEGNRVRAWLRQRSAGRTHFCGLEGRGIHRCLGVLWSGGGKQLLVSEQDLFNPQAHPPLDPAVTQLWCLLESFSVKQKVLHLPGR